MDKNVSIKWYGTLDSTNSQARREAEESCEGSVWIADFQTAGRGQRGNRWESRKGENLTFSILFKPEFLPPHKQFLISQVCAVGIYRYLAGKGMPASIKWPNDIYIGNKKICGILIENSISGDKLSVSIAGIGLNLNQTQFASDAPNPTSLLIETIVRKGYAGRPSAPHPAEKGEGNHARQADATGGHRPWVGMKPFDRKEELRLLLGYIFTAYDELKEGFAQELANEYTENLYRLGEFHKFIEIAPDAPADIPVEKIMQGKEITARIMGCDEAGCAILEHEDGTVRSYPFKGIRYVISGRR
ncbi:MAG: biotin--[Bacteroidales bacterium]|nr:biotin--[acetyl-CoA-carboxylase] ligase [Bacteroidales bacterium]